MKLLQFEMTSCTLHLLAMALMLCDHIWGILSGPEWLTCIGRLSFPIFAFLIVEGYVHTKNLKRYVTRLVICAIISELPFNLAMGGRLFYPVHQNVLWTFLISIALIHFNEQMKHASIYKRILACCFSICLACLIGLITMVDYYHAGILTVFVFYFFRGRDWWCYVGQFVFLWIIHTELLGGLVYEIQLFETVIVFAQQSLAVLALIPLWLYKGKQGYTSKALQTFYYLFYPVHLLILSFIQVI